MKEAFSIVAILGTIIIITNESQVVEVKFQKGLSSV